MGMDENRPTRRIVTLTSDWGQYDYYCGMLKGQIISSCPTAHIVDLSHDVPNFSLTSAAFIVKHSFHNFPKGSIHLILVNSESSTITKVLAFEYLEHTFIVPDNGIIGLLMDVNLPKSVYTLEMPTTGSFTSSHLFVKALESLFNGQTIEEIGIRVEQYQKINSIKAIIEESQINGSIIYIDSYKNGITNISKELFERIGRNRPYTIYVQSAHNRISKLSIGYHEVDPGELLALFNTANLLEIAIRNGNAADLLSLSIGSSIRIVFKENE